MNQRLGLSKSRLTAYRQCRKRLWLSVHEPGLAAPPSPAARAAFAAGEAVGRTAQGIYGPGTVLFDAERKNYRDALERSTAALARIGETFFEAAYQAQGVLVIADVIRVTTGGVEVIEVKSSTELKDYYRDDAAIQAHVLRGAGVPLTTLRVAHVDNQFRYPGNGDYRGLLVEHDLTAETAARSVDVSAWIADASEVLAGTMPEIAPGKHCDKPFECPFKAHCAGPQPEYPLKVLRGLSRKGAAALNQQGVADVRDIPTEVAETSGWADQWRAVLDGTPLIRADEVRPLIELSYPRYYLDFETINFAVPRWAGTRPYQAIPFQWSVHVEAASGAEPAHYDFLDLSGDNPARRCMEALITCLGDAGPVLTYSSYEKTTLNAMRKLLPDLDAPLAAIVERLFDLLPVTKAAYFHRDLKGSWSIKKVLPTIDSTLTYAGLGEVQDGGQAQQAYLEAIEPDVAAGRKETLRLDMLGYCKRDTEAMIAVARRLSFFDADQ